MAAPAITARVAPTGIKLKDGFSTTIAFSRKPNINLWEKGVPIPGVDGGEPIPQSTMLNTLWETMAPRALLKVPPISFTAAYDPAVLSDILALVNQEGSATVHAPDGTTISVYAYLQKFVPKELKIGEQPEADTTVVITNFDPVNHIEVGPLIVSVAGT